MSNTLSLSASLSARVWVAVGPDVVGSDKGDMTKTRVKARATQYAANGTISTLPVVSIVAKTFVMWYTFPTMRNSTAFRSLAGCTNRLQEHYATAGGIRIALQDSGSFPGRARPSDGNRFDA